ncbi:MAG: ORF6N domain-containing protein [Planctomycetota bacterium]
MRGEKVLLDKNLAVLYGVTTGNLNKAVSRNLTRFPKDFMFQLTPEEFRDLIFQFGTSRWGGTRQLPRAFTEQGVAMLSSVLRSERAVQVNIEIMRAFVSLRRMLGTNADLARKLAELEHKYDRQFAVVFDAIRQLMEPPSEPPKPRIGFHVKESAGRYTLSRKRKR